MAANVPGANVVRTVVVMVSAGAVDAVDAGALVGSGSPRWPRGALDGDEEHPTSRSPAARPAASAARRIQIVDSTARGEILRPADHRHVPGVELEHLAAPEVLDEPVLLLGCDDDVVVQADPDPPDVVRHGSSTMGSVTVAPASGTRIDSPTCAGRRGR